MNKSAEKVLSYLAGNADINAVSVEELKKLVAESPYFPVTHFLFTKKLRAENNAQSSLAAQKTSLYFSNPYWLHYQLTEEVIKEDPFEELVETKSRENHGVHISTAATTLPETTTPTIPAVTSKTTSESNNDEAVGQIAETANTTTQNLEQPESKETLLAENIEKEGEQSLAPPYEKDAGEITSTSEEIVTPNVTLNTTDIADATIGTTIFAELPASAELEVVALEEEMAGVSSDVDTTTKKFIEEAEHQSENGDDTVQDEHDKMFQNIKAMLDASSEEADADTKDAVIPMDPYYTIDYFASQGIKLELDKNPQDQLGQNLKKFTQWLRHMKKLGPEDATEVINRTETDADIQKIADSSNTVREVVTEAMASVLEKQGKKEKAIELYSKLSFLNPDKNAYFADKIKKLKGI